MKGKTLERLDMNVINKTGFLLYEECVAKVFNCYPMSLLYKNGSKFC